MNSIIIVLISWFAFAAAAEPVPLNIPYDEIKKCAQALIVVAPKTSESDLHDIVTQWANDQAQMIESTISALRQTVLVQFKDRLFLEKPENFSILFEKEVTGSEHISFKKRPLSEIAKKAFLFEVVPLDFQNRQTPYNPRFYVIALINHNDGTVEFEANQTDLQF